MNQREKLEAEATAYQKGYGDAIEVGQAEIAVRERNAMLRGIRIGRNEVLEEMEGVQWSKLFGVVVAGSVIGCGIVLAMAVGLSFL